MRRVAFVLALLALLSAPATNVAAQAPHGHVPAPSDHGCSLYVSAPNPCDPESNN